jgi:hypothetical protein
MNSYQFDICLFVAGIALIASQLGSAPRNLSIGAKLRFLLTGFFDGGENGEGRVAGAGFVALVAALIVLLGLLYNSLHRTAR